MRYDTGAERGKTVSHYAQDRVYSVCSDDTQSMLKKKSAGNEMGGRKGAASRDLDDMEAQKVVGSGKS